MMVIKKVLLQWFTNCGIMSNQELAEELHKPIIRKFEKRNVHSSFIDIIWGADLADMQLVSKFNKGICFLLCVIDINEIRISFSFERQNWYCYY